MATCVTSASFPLPDMGKNTGNLAANFSVFSNFYVANVKIRGCCF